MTGLTPLQIRLLTYCLTKPGAYVDHPFGPDSTIVKAQKRIFAQFFFLRGEPRATFNCDAMTGDFYRTVYPGAVTRGYHCPPVLQPYFNTVSLDAGIEEGALLGMIDRAYAYILTRLTRAARRELEAGFPESEQN